MGKMGTKSNEDNIEKEVKWSLMRAYQWTRVNHESMRATIKESHHWWDLINEREWNWKQLGQHWQRNQVIIDENLSMKKSEIWSNEDNNKGKPSLMRKHQWERVKLEAVRTTMKDSHHWWLLRTSQCQWERDDKAATCFQSGCDAWNHSCFESIDLCDWVVEFE